MFYHLDAIIPTLAMAFVFLLGILKWQLFEPQIRIYVIHSILGVLVNLIATQFRNNHFIFNFYLFFDISLIVYAASLFFPYSTRRIILFLSYLPFSFVFFYSILKDGAHVLANWALITGSLAIVVIHIYLIIATESTNHKFHLPYFLIWIGILLYYAGNTPLFSLFRFLNLHLEKTVFYKIYSINDILTSARYCLVFFAMTLLIKKSQHKPTHRV